MASGGFEKWLAIAWLPSNDGQPLHTSPGDPGGATSWGITFATYAAWEVDHRRPYPSLRTFEAAPKDDLKEILRARYWNAVQGDALPVGVDLVVADASMLSGQGEAAHVLQGVVGAEQRGGIGPLTMAATLCMDPAKCVQGFVDAYRRHVNGLPTAPRFAGGWDRRIDDDRLIALQWLGASDTQVAAASPPQPAQETADQLNEAEQRRLGQQDNLI